MKLPFVKMHGTGNDFIVIDCRDTVLDDPHAVARRLCRRRFGIGADQMLVLEDSSVPDAAYRMAIFNADGSEVEMCGNGIRCFAKYLADRGLVSGGAVRIQTDAGVIVPRFEPDGLICVDMGAPMFEAERIPTTLHGALVDVPLDVGGRTFQVTCLSMGNPHCVVFVDDADGFPVREVGPAFEHHPAFPKRVNTEFVQVVDRANLKMRVWERGSGETMACGTGASAALVAAVRNELADRRATLHLKGGELTIEWAADDNHVYMTGPAVEVFTGTVELAPVSTR